ncbi:MAG: cytochrome P450 [Byssovorax sp.]
MIPSSLSLPPGLRRPPLVQLLQWTRDPLAFLDECSQRFGEIFTVRFTALGTVVFVSSPELVKQVFTGDPKVLHAGEANEILRPVVGASSVLLLDDAPHLRQRRLLLPPFHGERMASYAEQMRDIAAASLAKWPVRKAFPIYPALQAITLDVILRAVFGLAEGAQMHALAPKLVQFFHPPPALMIFLPQLQRDIALNPYRSFYRLREDVHRDIQAIVTERRRSADLAARTDILSLLLAARDEDGQPMTDDEIRDELMTMIVAGHETSATSLAWIFERILALPEVRAKVLAELRAAVGDARVEPAMLPRLEYLDAVIKEAMRLRPIVPLVVRRLAAPFTLGEYTLPKGVAVGPCIYLAHLRPEAFPDPRRFSPERWLGDKKLDPYAYFPFGGGIRRCIGMSFALYEMKIILATVLSRASLRLDRGPESIVRRGITLVPEHGTRVVMDRAA